MGKSCETAFGLSFQRGGFMPKGLNDSNFTGKGKSFKSQLLNLNLTF